MKEDALLDRYFKVEVRDQGLRADIRLVHFDSSFRCTTAQLLDWLKQKGIVHGIDAKVAEQICAEPEKFRDMVMTIAKGKPPAAGSHGTIRYHCQTNIIRHLPKQLEDGKVDYKQLIEFNNVRKGQLIAEIIPPTEGVDGTSVTGEVIKAPPGKEAVLKPGKNVDVSEEQDKLYASIDGLVSVERGQIHVRSVYEIDGDVDYGIGNIDFNGTVIVHGNVRNDFVVKASGDIQVFGTVESARLEAGGSIYIEHGIIGGQKGMVKAEQDIVVSYIQEGNVEAGGNVQVSQFILHSNVRAGKAVQCSGAKGLIVGGEIMAGESLEANIIGNLSATRTVIKAGSFVDLNKQTEQLLMKKKELEQQMNKIDQAIALLGKRIDSAPDYNKMKASLSTTKDQFMEKAKQIDEQLEDLRMQAAKLNEITIRVKETIYTGTQVIIGQRIRQVNEPMHGVCFRYVHGEIKMQHEEQ